MVGAIRIAEHIHAVVVPEEGEGLFRGKPLEPGERENLAAAVVLTRLVDRGTVGEAGWGEVEVGIDVCDDFGESDGLGCVVDFFGQGHGILIWGEDRGFCR